MLDVEKVIKGIEFHRKKIQTSNALFCLECPYAEPKPIKDWCMSGLMDDIYALMKEQEPVEPFCWNDDYGQHWKCGHCGKVIGANDKYCHECGRPVKHNEQQRT